MAPLLKDHGHIFLLSAGLGELATKEGALKLKELTYIHCQSVPIISLSHQFLSLANSTPKGLPCIFVVLEDGQKTLMLDSMKKLQGRANIIPLVITDVKDKPSKEFLEEFAEGRVFSVPQSGLLSALLSVIPLQRLAYDVTVARGFDPDRPRNLAKELTTK
mmetsp:Transcript_3347/g.3314  ORF Transcript_3347/g.3314 Transcript_3347/m.3314 type:complete len:161 (-) Transcript_3347:23-505(-)